MRVKVLPIFFASVLISAVRGDSLLTPCKTDDVECLTKTTNQFLSNTCKGIPEYDIRPIDPLPINSMNIEAPGDSGINLHFKNLKITGLKDQRFSDFKMDTAKKVVVLVTSAALNINGEVNLELSKKSKSFNGTFSLSGNVVGTATYSYDFKEDDKGVTHYEVGPEKITCQVLGEPNVKIEPKLEEALDADSEVHAMRRDKHQEISMLRKEVLCQIATKSYVTVIHNLRAAAKILPTTSFLIGV